MWWLWRMGSRDTVKQAVYEEWAWHACVHSSCLGLHIINLKQYDMYYNIHGMIFHTYQQYILSHFISKTLIYMMISWDYSNCNVKNMVKYPKFWQRYIVWSIVLMNTTNGKKRTQYVLHSQNIDALKQYRTLMLIMRFLANYQTLSYATLLCEENWYTAFHFWSCDALMSESSSARLR